MMEVVWLKLIQCFSFAPVAQDILGSSVECRGAWKEDAGVIRPVDSSKTNDFELL